MIEPSAAVGVAVALSPAFRSKVSVLDNSTPSVVSTTINSAVGCSSSVSTTALNDLSVASGGDRSCSDGYDRLESSSSRRPRVAVILCGGNVELDALPWLPAR